MQKMKVTIYDPLFSSIGHYSRYNKFIVELIDEIDEIDEIVFFSDNPDFNLNIKTKHNIKVVKHIGKIHSIQDLSNNSKGIGIISLGIKSFLHYIKLMHLIQKESANVNLFLSQGIFTFWLAVLFKNVSFSVSVISCKWLFDDGLRKPLKWLFKKFIKRSNGTIFTETIYEKYFEKYNLEYSIVIPDRYLYEISQPKDIDVNTNKINLISLGTISSSKNPIDFVNEFISIDETLKEKIQYTICGKIQDENVANILEKASLDNNNISLINNYLPEDLFNELLNSADFVVIPYNDSYTNFATSGVMWDCISNQKPFISPSNKLFSFYAEQYGIGMSFKKGKLNELLKDLTKNKSSIKAMMNENYKLLFNLYSKEKQIKRMQQFLENIEK